MTTYHHGSCTTVLVGKKASLDGSTMIARNEDGYAPLNFEKFVVVNPDAQPKHYQSKLSAFAIDLPADPLRYTATPDVEAEHGIWAAAGINSANVAMTATETITTNSRILGLDPLVKDGIGEEDLTAITLPYVHSAREAVLRLGALHEQYGTYESNGIAFADEQEVWYFDTIGGHHWAAVRIPDDAYVIAPNRFNIDWFDFNSDDTLCAADLQTIIDTNHLNPDRQGYNLRHIFGSATPKDTRYNNPRAWFGQKYLTPDVEQSPIDQDLPFICHANRLISVEDVKFIESSHYQNTPYDVYGTGSDADKKRFRPIGINRNQELHILQIRPDLPDALKGVHWLAFGPNTFNAVVPFYANASDTPAAYRDTTTEFDPTNMYWLTYLMATFGDYDFNLFEDQEDIFELNTVAACRKLQHTADANANAAKQSDITAYLTGINQQMADIALKQATHLLGEMVKLAAPRMQLQFTLND